MHYLERYSPQRMFSCMATLPSTHPSGMTFGIATCVVIRTVVPLSLIVALWHYLGVVKSVAP